MFDIRVTNRNSKHFLNIFTPLHPLGFYNCAKFHEIEVFGVMNYRLVFAGLIKNLFESSLIVFLEL